jgi:hypothetical protein
MTAGELTDNQFTELRRLVTLYRREAHRCMRGKSYLAGCMLIGAALEASLIELCHLHGDEIPGELIPKGQDGNAQALLDWSFPHLLEIGRACGWLPARVPPDEKRAQEKAQIGEWAIVLVLKDWQNFVHISRYLRDFQRRRMTKRRLEMVFEVFDLTTEHLTRKIVASLEAVIDEARNKLGRNLSP